VKIRFLTPASRDLADAAEYYEKQMPSLGIQFMDEVEAAIARIVAFPLAWQPLCATHSSLPVKSLSLWTDLRTTHE